MKYIAKYINESEWYRGHTTNTRPNDYIWMSSDKSQAKTYSEMNKIIQGGDALLSEYDIDLTKINLLDLSEYDMNDRFEDYEIENFLDELNIEYDYEDLFDFTEDDIPLSRLVNNITNDIMNSYDALLIKEDDIDTILIKRELI
jgi:hypothetical protein